MRDERTSRWVFDRPVHTDALFWTGVVLGAAFVVLEVTSRQFDLLSVASQLIAILYRFLVGLLVVGVVGGSARNFIRGYRNA